MALFDDEDEQDNTTESGGWGVDEDQRSSADSTVDDGSEPNSLSELDTATLSPGEFNGTLKRAIDREAGVVIYAYANGNAGGLTSVPLSETDLVDENAE